MNETMLTSPQIPSLRGNNHGEVVQHTQNTRLRVEKIHGYYIKQKVDAITRLRKILEYPEAEGEELIKMFQQELDRADVCLGSEIHKGLAKLQDKARIFDENKKKYYQNSEWLATLYTEETGYSPRSIESQGITLNHIFSGEGYKTTYPDGSMGRQIRGTIYTCIDGDDIDMEESKQHEHTHNCYDAFVNQVILRDLTPPCANPFRMYDMDGSIKNIYPFIDSSQGEIIANYNNLLKGNMESELKAYESICSSMDQSGNNPNQAIQRVLSKFKKAVRSFYECMQDLLTIANTLGIQGEVKSLMILYKPTEYRKIFRYLSHQYGIEKIQSIREQEDEHKVHLSILDK